LAALASDRSQREERDRKRPESLLPYIQCFHVVLP